MKIKHSQVVAANNEIVAKAKELLCDGGLRAKCFEAATLGKQYTADLLASAQKAVVVTAVKIAAERLARRARTGNAETPLHRRLDHYKREKAARFLKLYAEDVKAFRQAVHGQFRTATAGDHRTRVGIATVPGDIGAKGESCKGAAYSRRCWYRRTDSNHEYEIPPNWRKTVEQPGLAVLDGMVTLSAELECDQDWHSNLSCRVGAAGAWIFPRNTVGLDCPPKRWHGVPQPKVRCRCRRGTEA